MSAATGHDETRIVRTMSTCEPSGRTAYLQVPVDSPVRRSGRDLHTFGVSDRRVGSSSVSVDTRKSTRIARPLRSETTRGATTRSVEVPGPTAFVAFTATA